MDFEKKMLIARVMDMSEEEMRVVLLSMLDGVCFNQAIDLSFRPIKEESVMNLPSPSWSPCVRK